MVKKIISHLNPRHLDDFFAIALLKSRYPDADIEYVHPQNVPEEYYEDPQIILVDVGMQYSPEKKNYDHHHNLDIPCSLVLVLKHEPITGVNDITNHPAIQFIDLTDRYGVRKAAEQLRVPLEKEIDNMRRTILLTDIPKYATDIAKYFFYALQRTDNFNDFLRTLYEQLDNTGVLEEAKERIKEEERKFQERLSKAKTLRIGQLKVVLSELTLAPYHYRVFSELNADLIIEQNSMNDKHTSIIKNTNSERAKDLDLSRVFLKYRKVFLHKNGFIAVIDNPIESIDAEEIVKLISNSQK